MTAIEQIHSAGKMLTGIKVVNADEAQTDRVPLAQAVIRAAALLLSACTCPSSSRWST